MMRQFMGRRSLSIAGQRAKAKTHSMMKFTMGSSSVASHQPEYAFTDR